MLTPRIIPQSNLPDADEAHRIYDMLDRQAPAAGDGRTLTDRILHLVVLLILGLTAAVYAAAAPLAIGWSQRPFLGAFFEPTLVFNDIRSEGADQFPAFGGGLGPFARLVRCKDVAG